MSLVLISTSIDRNRLNMRTLSFTDGVQVYDRGEQYGRNIIARADNLATKERWNVPQVSRESLSARLVLPFR